MYRFCIEASIAEKQSRCFIRYQVEAEYINISNFLLVWKMHKSPHKSITVQTFFEIVLVWNASNQCELKKIFLKPESFLWWKKKKYKKKG